MAGWSDMRGVTRLVVGITLLVSGCSVDLDVGVLDAQGNATVVPVNTESISQSETASEGARGGGVDTTAASTATPASDPTPTPASDDGADQEPTPTSDDTTTTSPTATAASTPVPEATATPADSSGPTPTAAPAATPTPTAEPTATPTPAATPTPVPIEFVVAPDAALLGVDIGDDADEALESLEALIGEPDFDSDWYVGCPLDGDELDERLVQWGDLNVYFDRSHGDEIMRAWGYDLRIVDGGFPELELIELPGGSQMGDPVNEVAAAAGLEVRYDALFDINRVGEDGYEILSDAPPGAPVWGVFVPAIPTCE